MSFVTFIGNRLQQGRGMYTYTCSQRYRYFTNTGIRSPFVYGCHRCTRLLFDVPHDTRRACRLGTRLLPHRHTKNKNVFLTVSMGLLNELIGQFKICCICTEVIFVHRSHSAFHISHVRATRTRKAASIDIKPPSIQSPAREP